MGGLLKILGSMVLLPVAVGLVAIVVAAASAATRGTDAAADGPVRIRALPGDRNMAAARDYQAAGEYGLALVEVEQAVAALPGSRDSLALREEIRAQATAHVGEAHAAATAQARSRVDVELLPGWSCKFSATGNFMNVEGQVRNVSGGPLRSVQALVTWTTESGVFVTSDTGRTAHNPIEHGQVTTFRTMTPSDPAATHCKVEFKTSSGQALNMRRAGG